MGRYWAKIAQISDFAGKLQLGFIVIFWGGFVGAWRRGGAFCKALGARLPGGGLLFYEEKQAKDF